MLRSKFIRLYKVFIPEIIRNRITMLRNSGGLNTIRKNILAYYHSLELDDDEINMVLNFLKSNPLKVFPYSFPKKYKSSKIKVYHNYETNLNYVIHEGKRMYFKRSWGINEIRENYNNLLIEQDYNSPHRYLNESFTIEPYNIIADIGAAEGIFALSNISEAKKIYLFETDFEWIEALRETFRPWIDKIEIINMFVSDKNDDIHISLDEFSKNRNVIFDFIKIDVDGSEFSLLKGCKEIFLNANKIKIAICTYHKSGDEELFRNFFREYEIEVSPSPGYMIFYYDTNLSAPYLRRGLLRGAK